MLYINEILKALENADFDGALKLIETHRIEHGNEPEFITVQAILCIKTQEFEVARDILLDGVSIHPGNADLMYNLGYTYNCMANVGQALECYKRAIELTDDEDFIGELKELCADIESSPEFIYPDKKNNDNSCDKVSIISQNELKSMNFDVDLNNTSHKKIRFLLRRLEFGIESEKTANALSTAISTGRVNKEDFSNVAAMAWIDKSRLNEIADIINA